MNVVQEVKEVFETSKCRLIASDGHVFKKSHPESGRFEYEVQFQRPDGTYGGVALQISETAEEGLKAFIERLKQAIA